MRASLMIQTGKNAYPCRRCRFDPWVGKIPWRRKWQPTPIFLPGEFRGQRSLVGYSPRGLRDSDTTDQLSAHMVDEQCCFIHRCTTQGVSYLCRLLRNIEQRVFCCTI